MAKMSREEFAALVRRLEGDAARDPKGYRVRIGLLAALGYGFLIFIVLLVVALLAALVALLIFSKGGKVALLKVVFFLGIFLLVLLRSLYVRFGKPDGILLTKEQAGPLFAAVERLTDAINAPRFHKILLTPDYNASVVQYPRLGVFGWHENYLSVGLPLLQTLSPAQFEAVLAHELGHLRGGHGRFGAWIYRVNITWAQVPAQLDDDGAAVVLRTFFRWYSPFFAAYSFALRRQDEYEADRIAAGLTSPRTTADALCALPVYDNFLDKHYWEPLTKNLETMAAPPNTPYTGMLHLLSATPVPLADAETALKNALSEETGMTDTHPSLTDRLKALGQEARLLPAPAETAAQRYFGPHLSNLTQKLDAVWYENVRPIWEQKHKETVAEKQLLEQLEARAAGWMQPPLTPEEQWKQAELTERYHTAEQAVPLYSAFFTHPELQAAAHFAVGRILLQQDNPEGIALLEQAMAHDHQASLPALGVIYAYHKRHGNEEAAKAVYQQGMQHADKQDEAEEERAHFGTQRSRYLPHGLSPDVVAQVRTIVQNNPDVAEAYLVCKAVQHFPEQPLYVLGVTLTHEWKRLQKSEDSQRVFESLAGAMIDTHPIPPENTFIVVIADQNAWFKAKARQVPDSLIYQRTK